MRGLFRSVKHLWRANKVVRIVAACVLGLSTISAAAAGIYILINDELPSQAEEVVEEVEVEEEAAAEDVYIPAFESIVLTSESLEKDLTLYISDENDNAITGVPFSVKLLSKDKAKDLQSYIDEIDAVNTKIAEMTGEKPEETSEEEKKSEEKSEEKAEENSEDASAETAKISEADRVLEILQNRNVDITVTDENGEVIEKQKSHIKDDPLYQLYLDKEAAIQSFAMALKDADGTVYTDDDQDGVIAEKDMKPGDYVACVMYDFDNQALYDPSTFATPVNVKDKVEFKVQKEITKQIKKDVASEDNQPKEVTPVEEVPKDTVEWVDSRKEENGGSAKGISSNDITAPSGGNSNITVTKKDSHIARNNKLKKGQAVFCSNLITDRIAVRMLKWAAETGAAEGSTGEVASGDGASSLGGSDTSEGQQLSSGEGNGNASQEPTQGNDAQAETPAKNGDSEKPADQQPAPAQEDKPKTNYTVTVEYKDTDGNKLKEPTSETKEEGSSYNYTAPVIEKYDIYGTNTLSGTFDSNKTIGFIYQKAKSDTAQLNASYSNGALVITVSSNISSVAVNGTAISISNGQGKFAISTNGDYKVTGVADLRGGATDVYAIFAVSGFSTEQLKDKEGHPLFLDEALTKPVTASDYARDKTYYYKCPSYTYYGFQSIDGATYYFDKNGNKVTGEQVIRGVKYNFGPDGALLVKGTGIDVSKYQGNIDWKQAKSSIGFAIIRCGYRGQSDGQLHEDSYFYKNMKGAKAAGVATGVYIFSRALNEAEAVQEASMAVAMANKAGGCAYPIYLDMEDTTRGQHNLSNAQRVAIVNAFVSTVQSSGYKAGLYCSKNWMTKRMDAGSIAGSTYIWIAQYNTSCTYSGKYSMWQYSSSGSVPGIKGRVDMNKSFF